jgi:hypothetical protein
MAVERHGARLRPVGGMVKVAATPNQVFQNVPVLYHTHQEVELPARRMSAKGPMLFMCGVTRTPIGKMQTPFYAVIFWFTNYPTM